MLAIQDSAVGSHKLPTSDLIGIGAQKANRVVGQTSHAVIGYKGQRSVTWMKENYKESGGEPAVVSSSIPISFLYLPEGKRKTLLLLGWGGSFFSFFSILYSLFFTFLGTSHDVIPCKALYFKYDPSSLEVN